MATVTSSGATGSTSTTTTATHTTTATAATNDWVIVVVNLWSNLSRTVSSVSAGSITCSSLFSPANSGNYCVAIYGGLATSGLASGSTVTVTFSGAISDGAIINVANVSGLVTSSLVDGTGTATRRTSSLNTSWDSGTTTTANATDLLIGCGFSDGSGTSANESAPGTNWTEVNEAIISGNQWAGVLQYREVSSTGNYSASGTWTQTPGFADQAAVVALKVSGGAAAVSSHLEIPARRAVRGLYIPM